MKIQEFFDPATSTLTYTVWDEDTRDALVIDPVLDYDPASGTVSEESVTKVEAYLREHRLALHFLLETHAHADHLSGSQALKRRFPKAKVAIAASIVEVQRVFRPVFDLPESFPTNGSQFDHLFSDRERFAAGSLSVEVLFTPGHTPACASYRIGDAVFTGDVLFMPDSGVGRCDFPSGSAEALYRSVTERLYTLPEATRVFTGHDYLPGGRPLRFESTIGDEKRSNVHLHGETRLETFVDFRNGRDKTLGAPRLLFPSVQVNIAAGHLPARRDNGRSYLVIPLKRKD